MATKRPGVAASPAKQKYDAQEIKMPKGKLTEDKIYAGRTYPNMNTRDSPLKDESLPQFKNDRMIDREADDVKDGWLRGTDGRTAMTLPGNKPHSPGYLDNPIPSGKCRATGDDRQKSPWSAAHRTYKED